jgi:hypothetical protein
MVSEIRMVFTLFGKRIEHSHDCLSFRVLYLHFSSPEVEHCKSAFEEEATLDDVRKPCFPTLRANVVRPVRWLAAASSLARSRPIEEEARVTAQ